MDAPKLCIRSCGFYGSPEQHDLCSNCYNDFLREKIVKSSGIASVIDDHLTTRTGELSGNTQNPQGSAASEFHAQKPVKNRCRTCSKRLGLLGFQCRCGDLFCGTHRHPEEHACTVDFKRIARKTFAEQNPACIADRMQYRV